MDSMHSLISSLSLTFIIITVCLMFVVEKQLSRAVVILSNPSHYNLYLGTVFTYSKIMTVLFSLLV